MQAATWLYLRLRLPLRVIQNSKIHTYEQKKCPCCGSPITKKNGVRYGVQLYKCMSCGHQFRGKVYLSKEDLWKAYREQKQTVRELAAAFGVSESTIKRLLKDVSVEWKNPVGCGRVVVSIDATYFGRDSGVLVVLDTQTGKPLYVKHIRHERVSDYMEAIREIEKNGFLIDGIVIDGMQSLFKEFSSYKVQMCQYHMCAIVRRKITKNPKLEAGVELQWLMHTLKDSKKADFTSRFSLWKEKWKAFLDQRTVNRETGKTFYTHQRIRSAMLSVEFYIPWLFTFQDVEGMPNTNNKIEGTFTDLKRNLNNHSGMSKENRKRFIDGFFLALNGD